MLPDGLAERAAWLRRLLSQWAIAEVAPGRLMPWLPVAYRLRHRRLFHRRPRTGLVGGRRRWRLPASSIGDSGAPARVRLCPRARLCRHRRRLCHRHVADRAHRASGAGVSRPASVPSPASSRSARNASAATASWCACSTSKRRRLEPSATSACGVAVRKGTAPAVGSFVAFKAHLAPPLAPLRPGGYDFARDMYFQRIGASGYALGTIKIVPPPASARPLAALCRAASTASARRSTSASTRCCPGDRGSIASALITGKRDAISDAGQRRLVCLEPRPCAVDLRLSHGGGGGHRLLFHPRRPGADPVARQPLPDQEMGGRGRARRRRRSISLLSGAERRDPALLHHDRHRAGRRHGRPAGADFPHDHDRRLRSCCCSRRRRSCIRASRCRLRRRSR